MTFRNDEILQEIFDLSFFNPTELKNFICNRTNMFPNDVSVDNLGNLIYSNFNSELLIIFKIVSSGISVNRIKDNKAYIDLVGFSEKDKINGKNTSIGRIKEDSKEYYIELKEENTAIKHKIYEIKEQVTCEVNSLYGKNIKSRIPLYMLLNTLLNSSHNVKRFSFTVINESVSSPNSFSGIIKRLNPKKVLFISSVYTDENFKQGCGPAFVIKDGNCVIAEKDYSAIKKFADKYNISVQPFIGKTDNILEKISVSKSDLSCNGIYLPVKKFNTGEEKILYEDIQKTLNLLLKCIDNL